MARATVDPAIHAHLEWLGFVRPTGLVVSAPALVRAGAILDRHDAEGQKLLRSCLDRPPDAVSQISETASAYAASLSEAQPILRDFREFAESVLGWNFSPLGYCGTAEHPIPEELEAPLSDYGETLRPDFAVKEPDEADGARAWQLLVSVLDPREDFDRPIRSRGGFEASHHGRLERLLRATGVSAGVLFNGHALRLLSAPYGESSGWLDFRVADMVQTAGRPISAALRLLLGQPRLLGLPRKQRLASLLDESRKYQNEVSERLSEQVLHALYELLRGFQAAHDGSKGLLLRELLRSAPDEVYHALLTVVLRLVFLLYAEERDMLPADETFVRNYSLSSLYERLREDTALFPDTMEQRYGAWAQLLVLFRMIHNGADAGTLHLPKREGVLFNPERFKFLEGRSDVETECRVERIEPPLVPDGTIYRALEKLLVLDGERISYRALDVEQIGSVYETMMGFRLETATGPSIATKAQKKHGAPTAVSLEALLAESSTNRAKWLQERTDRKLTDKVNEAVKAAATIEDLHAALLPVIDSSATPDIIAPGAMVLQPSEERRRSGSHYTPRSLTEPIVRTTLEPILARLRGRANRAPRPEQILGLKVCDMALGSGAFLVETCRQLGDALIESWRVHDARPAAIPPDEDEVVHARRLVAQCCLYGVDRNPVAVDLAKVSLWLATLAKDHPLTFLDHSLRYGDSLVGLSRMQIEAFHWEADAPPFQPGLETMRIRERLEKVATLRKGIRDADGQVSIQEKTQLWAQVQEELREIRLLSDTAVSAFFSCDKPRERKAKRDMHAGAILNGDIESLQAELDEFRSGHPPIVPFHWEIEFPEVFERENPGFDAIVGNPPYAGKNTVATANRAGYQDWLKQVHEGSHGNADLVAHFFRRAYGSLRDGGTFGLIATNTIAQGDTRSTGLRWICTNGGDIYCARRRVTWPGRAAVVVSVLHMSKGVLTDIKRLDNQSVPRITAFLFHGGGHDDPKQIKANAGRSFQGSIVLGMGFTFDDTDRKRVATPLAEMRRLEKANARNRQAILPYIGGEELNTNPSHEHHRYVIDFGERTEEECRRLWPRLMEIVESKVKPARQKLKKSAIDRKRARDWWQYGSLAKELYLAISKMKRVLAINCGATPHASFSFLSTPMVFANTLALIAVDTYAAFCNLQSRPHEVWARFFGSSMRDDLRYTPSDCFETFPFPEEWNTHPALETAGAAYYGFRSALMVRNGEGMTKTYNRFHDPDESDPSILKLRELHADMDRAVLNAYGWNDIPIACEFLLDYEIDEEEWGKKRKPYRYRWPDSVRDEVLARLLELNAERAREEMRVGAAVAATDAGKTARKRQAKKRGQAAAVPEQVPVALRDRRRLESKSVEPPARPKRSAKASRKGDSDKARRTHDRQGKR
jgi:hypothetical protein